jgi:Zn-finger nucleic acid-binding protein
MLRLLACPSCRTQYDVTSIPSPEIVCPCGARLANRSHVPIDAPILRCGACGAAVAKDAESCGYCRGSIIRDPRQLGLICPECFARTPLSSKYCTRCGIRFLPQPAPGTTREIACPRDGNALIVRAVGGLLCHECRTCHGVWVPSDDFDALIEKAIGARRARPSDGLGTRPPTQRPARSFEVVYRKCPECGDVMLRKNYAGRSGIIVDWCGSHGTWLDADELEEIAAYISEGGLAKPAELTTEQKRAYHLSARPVADLLAPNPESRSLLDFFADLVDS